MNPHPQTIQIFLPSGAPQGIHVAGITTRIVRVLDVPRSLLGEFLAMPEASQVGVYFLFGEDEETGHPMVYIGQTGSLAERLANHDQKKEFWNRALVAISLTNNLTSTHALFLEWLSIKTAGAAARYKVENGNSGSCPHTPPPLEAECNELHETLRILLATLGYPVFEPLARPATKSNDGGLLYCRASEADARGQLTEEGFVVLKGSSGRAEVVPSLQRHSFGRLREQLTQQGVIVAANGRIHFEKDYLFSSPSAAASCVTGRTANGLMEWKDGRGRTLREIRERNGVAADS